MNLIFNYFLYNKIFTQMKIKNMKLMLLGLFGLMSTVVSAQPAVGKYFPKGSFIYQVKTMPADAETPGTAEIVAVLKDQNPVDGTVLKLEGNVSTVYFDVTYNFDVIGVKETTTPPIKSVGALQTTAKFLGEDKDPLTDASKETAEFAGMVTAQSVEIPAQFTSIATEAFAGYTSIKNITFATGSKLTTIKSQGFTSTQTAIFNFSNCTELTTIEDRAFVDATPGKENTYITSITLPATSKVNDINKAFQNLPNMTEIVNLDKSKITNVEASAFLGDKKLTTVVLPNTVKTIEAAAFENSSVANLTIDVKAFTTGAAGVVYGTSTDVLKSLTLTGTMPSTGTLGAGAFAGNTELATLDLTGLRLIGTISANAFNGCTALTNLTFTNGIEGGTIAANAFQNCDGLETVDLGNLTATSSVLAAFNSCDALESVKIGNLSNTASIGAGAFTDCNALETISIGDIAGTASIAGGAVATTGTHTVKNVTIGNITGGTIGAAAFGDKLENVTIGTVDAVGSILTNAFKFADAESTLKIAQGAEQYLDKVASIQATAFDFSALTGTNVATINIGELRDAAYAAKAVKGNNIKTINFTGDIKKAAAVIQLVEDNTGDGTIDNLVLEELNFNGAIVAGGIAAFAPTALAKVAEVNFNGKLAAGAVATGAFLGLVANSEINYNVETLEVAERVNPFKIDAFAATDVTRDLILKVKNEYLQEKYADPANGLGAGAGKAFEVYRIIFIPVDGKLTAYVNNNETKVAWAREAITSTADYVAIPRVQSIAGTGKVKVTLYGMYTDEDPIEEQSTIYMVPLQAQSGKYYIPKTNTETLIARVEKKDGTAFELAAAPATVTEVKLTKEALTTAEFTALGVNNSIWTNLGLGTDLHVAKNIMTNQYLVDKSAMDGTFAAGAYLYQWIDATPKDEICRDIYVMSNPAKGKGFRIDKNEISSTNGMYINTGWYYLMLAKFANAPAEARVVWLGEDDNVTAILGVKKNLKPVQNGVIYNLQGVRVDNTVKGQVYIMNGKKFIAQ